LISLSVLKMWHYAPVKETTSHQCIAVSSETSARLGCAYISGHIIPLRLGKSYANRVTETKPNTKPSKR